MNDRIIISGWARTGKTYFSCIFQDRPVYHTDKLIPFINSEEEMFRAVCDWMRKPGPWVIEGVGAVGAIEKYLLQYKDRPCEKLYWFSVPRTILTKAQLEQGKRLSIAMRKIEDELSRRGVEVIKTT